MYQPSHPTYPYPFPAYSYPLPRIRNAPHTLPACRYSSNCPHLLHMIIPPPIQRYLHLPLSHSTYPYPPPYAYAYLIPTPVSQPLPSITYQTCIPLPLYPPHPTYLYTPACPFRRSIFTLYLPIPLCLPCLFALTLPLNLLRLAHCLPRPKFFLH